jgi:hypothetical protein
MCDRERPQLEGIGAGAPFGLGGGNGHNGAAAADQAAPARAARPGTIAPRSDVRSLLPILWQIDYTVNDNVSVWAGEA